MEATGSWNGGRGPWSYPEQSGSSSHTISSTSGTVSTAGHTSIGSHLSWSWISMEAKLLEERGEQEDTRVLVQPLNKFRKEKEIKHTELTWLNGMSINWDEEMKMEQIKSLAKEFFGAPSAKWSIEGGDMSVLEKWFKELGVGWVLHFSDGAAAAGKLEQTLDASSWIPALNMIKHACLKLSHFCSHGSRQEEGPATESEEQGIMTDQVQFASFTQLAILKMLAFVDFIDLPNLNITCDDDLNITCDDVSTIHLVAPYQKLYTMLRVHDALDTGLYFNPQPSSQVGRIEENVDSLLSEKRRKAGEAIWNTMEEIKNGILESVEDGDDSSCTQHPQGSPDIQKATWSVVCYIRFLNNNFMLVRPIISEAARLGKYVPQIEGEEYHPLRSLYTEMFCCVQEKLANKSERFTDQSLRFIFLLNNLSFLGDLVLNRTSYFPISYKAVHIGIVEGYMKRYIQVSWAPVLACLFNRKPVFLFKKNYSKLLKFESEFHKTYTTQKLWKVPNPNLRRTLREAIIFKIVPSYTKYIEDNKVTTPKFTPQNLEEMLQELFEG